MPYRRLALVAPHPRGPAHHPETASYTLARPH